MLYPKLSDVGRVSTQDRLVSKPYVIEDKNGKKIQLNTGDGVLIPVGAIHMDPRYYPNPEIFDPERFNDENKHCIRPDTYLPFGAGARNCVTYLMVYWSRSNSPIKKFQFSDCIKVCFNGNQVLLSAQKFCHRKMFKNSTPTQAEEEFCFNRL